MIKALYLRLFGNYGFWRTILGYRLSRVARTTLWLVVGLYVVSTWPQFYWATPILGKVVDAETGEPLEGVVVVARWSLGEWLHGNDVGSLAIMEDITNARGEYSFSWRVPRYRPFLTHLIQDPKLIYFKYGYKHEIRVNGLRSRSHYSPIRTSDWHNAEIELDPFEGSVERYYDVLSNLRTNLRWTSETECTWKSVPNMTLVLSELYLYNLRQPKSMVHRIDSSEFNKREVIDAIVVSHGTKCEIREYYEEQID